MSYKSSALATHFILVEITGIIRHSVALSTEIEWQTALNLPIAPFNPPKTSETGFSTAVYCRLARRFYTALSVEPADPQTIDSETGQDLSWPRYDEKARATLIINGTDSIENDPDGDIRQAWGEQILGFK